MKIALIGKGRVATHLGKALVAAGHDVTCCGGRVRIVPVPADAEIIIISVKDDAIGEVAKEFAASSPLTGRSQDARSPLVLHTSGSVPMDAIPSPRRGVFYPMQTFSLERPVDFRSVPLFLESSTPEDMDLLSSLAATISDTYMPLDAEGRRTLHLAAVLSCNFVNHLYELSYDVLQRKGIPFSTLFPLMEETLDKLHALTPHEAQTGPAVRGDESVMQRHIDMLDNPLLREIYRLLSSSIQATHNTSAK